MEVKQLVALIENGYAENIGGQKIGSELNALELGIHGAREGFGQGGLAGPWEIFEEHMAAAGQRGQQLPGRGSLPLHDTGNIGSDVVINLARGLVRCPRLGAIGFRQDAGNQRSYRGGRGDVLDVFYLFRHDARIASGCGGGDSIRLHGQKDIRQKNGIFPVRPIVGRLPTMNFSIAPITADEIPALLEMIRELARFERLEDEVEATVEILRESLCGPEPSASALLARCGDEPAGYALYYFTFCSFAGRPGLWLDDLYVRPEFRKRGLGKALIQEVARIGAGRNCARMEWIALDWNEKALEFYGKIGARKLDDWVLLRLNSESVKDLANKL